MNPLPIAQSLAALLAQRDVRVVFAESCTAGLVSAELAKVPGISQWLCGSAVTYREATKTQWIDVASDLIAEHTVVSAEVARQMASGVIERTTEADCSAAITGHLGPGAPEGMDGIVYIATAIRRKQGSDAIAERFQLTSPCRIERQQEAAQLVLAALHDRLLGTASPT